MNYVSCEKIIWSWLLFCVLSISISTLVLQTIYNTIHIINISILMSKLTITPKKIYTHNKIRNGLGRR